MTPTEQITVPKQTWDAMREAHRKLIRAYVNLLESGRDRIVSLGGTCDPVDQMEAGDPALREAKAALTAANVAVANQQEIDKNSTETRANAGFDGGGELSQPLSESAANAVQPQAQGEAVYLVATGETHNGEETYCRYDYPPALSEFERLYTHPQATEPAWRPIETAPKDGSEILLFGDGRVTYGNWSAPSEIPRLIYRDGFAPEEEWDEWEPYWASWNGGFTEEHPPTHWQPKPAAPEAKQ